MMIPRLLMKYPSFPLIYGAETEVALTLVELFSTIASAHKACVQYSMKAVCSVMIVAPICCKKV